MVPSSLGSGKEHHLKFCSKKREGGVLRDSLAAFALEAFLVAVQNELSGRVRRQQVAQDLHLVGGVRVNSTVRYSSRSKNNHLAEM